MDKLRIYLQSYDHKLLDQSAKKIAEVVKQLNQREPNINVQVEKGIGYIHTNTGNINF